MMPGRDRIIETMVPGYEYERGGREVYVHGHRTHVHVGGEPIWIVLWRPKDRVLRGGTKHDQRRAHFRWNILGQHFHTEASAEAQRRLLMNDGDHAIVEKIGARERMPSLRSLERDANRADRRRERRERE